MYVHGRSSPALVVRSPTRQCVIASARWVSEMILATTWVWETIAASIIVRLRKEGACTAEML